MDNKKRLQHRDLLCKAFFSIATADKMHQTLSHGQRTTSDTRLPFMCIHHNLHNRLDSSPLGMTLSLSRTKLHINLMSGLY